MKNMHNGLRDHIRLLFPVFGFIAGVWLLRWVMDAAGTPWFLTRLVSVTVASGVSVLLAVLLIHSQRFGSYPSVVVASFFINLWAEGLISAAILLTMLTGKTNIYSAPQYSGMQGHFEHLRAHLTLGIAIGTLEDSAVGCLLLWLLRTLIPDMRSRAPADMSVADARSAKGSALDKP
jgi:hypothetical protein